MTLAHQFERIVDGGAVTDRIDMAGRTAIACALGGPEGRTLFLLSSTDAYPERLIGTKASRVDAVMVDVPHRADSTIADERRSRRCPTPTTNSSTPTTHGERFHATDLVRSTWTAAIQHGAPVSALLVRALERCAPRDDTRLSRVMIDLLGGVPAEGDLWVRAQVDRPGKQIELVSAEMLAPGPRRRTPHRGAGQRLAVGDARHRAGRCTRLRRRCARWPRPSAATWRRTGTATTSTASTGAG